MVGAALGAITPGTVIDKVEIRKQLREVYTTSFYGMLTTNSFGMNDQRTMSVYQYDAAAAVQLVAPLSAATGRVSYPSPPLASNERNAPCAAGTKVIGDNRMCSSAEQTNASAPKILINWCSTVCESCPPGRAWQMMPATLFFTF